MLFVRIQHLLCRGEKGSVYVLDGGDFLEKVGKILLLGEAGKLRDIVKAHIDNPCYIRSA